jgi:predicted DNA-binding mobile mystery protein A
MVRFSKKKYRISRKGRNLCKYNIYIVNICFTHNLLIVIMIIYNNIYIVFMSDRFKRLQRQQLDQHIAAIRMCDRPSDGWIRAVRKALGMGAKQLARRMGVSQQALSQLERKECEGAVTLKTLRKAAEAMGCTVVYAILPPDATLEDLIYRQALLKARELVGAVDHTMQLEAQGVGNTQEKIEEMAEMLAKSPDSGLWEK